jgi:hypothetical protein
MLLPIIIAIVIIIASVGSITIIVSVLSMVQLPSKNMNSEIRQKGRKMLPALLEKINPFKYAGMVYPNMALTYEDSSIISKKKSIWLMLYLRDRRAILEAKDKHEKNLIRKRLAFMRKKHFFEQSFKKGYVHDDPPIRFERKIRVDIVD